MTWMSWHGRTRVPAKSCWYAATVSGCAIPHISTELASSVCRQNGQLTGCVVTKEPNHNSALWHFQCQYL